LRAWSRTDRFGLAKDDWVEIVDDDLVLQNGAVLLLMVQLIDSDNLVVTLSGSHLPEVGKNPAKQPVATKTPEAAKV
jgi:hypothetical protein